MKKGILGKRVVSTLCAAAMVTGGLPAVALATERDSVDETRIPTTAQNTNGYVTGVCLDAPRDMATLELLGVSSVNDAQGNNDLAGYGTGYTTVPGTAWDKAYYAYDHDWNHTQYWLFASAYNENSNPFWVNRGIGATVSDDQKGVVAGKLMGSLAAYGADETSTAVWDMMPNLFMASSASSLSNLASITPDGTVDEKFANYHPLTAANTLDNFTSYIAGMKAVAEAADTAAKGTDGIAGTDDDLQLRYGSATAIADAMQQWLLGTQGYVLKNIMNGTVQKKTIAVLGSSSSQGGGGGNKGGARSLTTLDEDTPTTWSLSTTYNEAYEGIVTADASYDGVVLPTSIANNLATTLGKATVTTEELSQADLIVVTSSDQLTQLIAAGLGDKVYYGGTNSGVIHSAANAELFQQMPRVLPCLYPELLDQSDFMAYMYDEFYHLNDGDLLYEACVNLFGCGNGVLNWAAKDTDGDGTISADEKMTWTKADFAGYSAENVEKIYEEGWDYLQNVKSVTGTTTLSYKVGDGNIELDAKDPDGNSGRGILTVESDNTDVVTAAPNGRIACKAAGTAHLTIKSVKYPDAIPLVVTVTVTSDGGGDTPSGDATVDVTDYTIYLTDKSVQYGTGEFNVYASNGEALVWDSSADENIVTFSSRGWVKPVAEGTTTIVGHLPSNTEKTFTITIHVAKTDISSATISEIADQDYTGEAIEPAITVSLNDSNLVADTDYTVTYSNNTMPGTATVTVTGTGNYTGSVTSQFNITGTVPSTGVEGFVDRLYQNVLGRAADASGREKQIAGMKTLGAAQITYNFYNSNEFKEKAASMTSKEIVDNVYLTMLNRPADAKGEAMWISYLDSGMSACAVVAGFVESKEFATTCSSYGISTGSAAKIRASVEPRDVNYGMTAFTQRLYSVVLGRTADVKGLNNQTKALQNGMTCCQLAVNFFLSKEYTESGKTDEQIIEDCYQAMLGRASDTQAHRDYWVNRLSTEGLEKVVRGFCESTEFEKICQKYNMTSGAR